MPRLNRMYFLFFTLITAVFPAVAQQKLDIIQIMGQFVQVNYAASKCLKPDQDKLSRFLANFKIVTVRASEEIRKRNPSMSEQQVAESFKKGSDIVENQINGVLVTSGCSDPRIQDLLKRFEIQVNLKL